MANTVATSAVHRHRVIPETRPAMVKADLRKPETRVFWAELGTCLDEARRAAGWNLDELADALKRDPRQVRRWIAGEEQTQVAAVFSVPALQQPFVIALAKLAACDVKTTIEIRRSA